MSSLSKRHLLVYSDTRALKLNMPYVPNLTLQTNNNNNIKRDITSKKFRSIAFTEWILISFSKRRVLHSENTIKCVKKCWALMN
jgi:hypothetical protein